MWGGAGEAGGRWWVLPPHPLLPQTIKKTRFPRWDEVLELRAAPGAPSPLRVELWDWDMVGKNDFLGMVSAPLQHPLWLPIATEGEGGGRRAGRPGPQRADVKAAWVMESHRSWYRWGNGGSQKCRNLPEVTGRARSLPPDESTQDVVCWPWAERFSHITSFT